MNVRRDLAINIAACTPTVIQGRFQRHSSLNWAPLTGSASGGRWGRPNAYSVLYLGRPDASVVVEAYRHLVDDIDGMRPDLVRPRRVVTCEINVTNLLDLRDAEHRLRIGLTNDDLESPVGDYETCQQIGAVAHQLGLHGVVAPSASQYGETLALFEQHLPANELPIQVGDGSVWEGLPTDPRRTTLHVVNDED